MEKTIYRTTLLLLFALLFFGGLYVTAAFLIPLSFAALLAMLMLPLGKWLERKGLARALSIVICLLVIFVIMASIIFVLSYQVVGFAENFAQMKGVFLRKVDLMQHYIESKLNISSERQVAILKERISHMSDSADTVAQGFVSAITGTVTSIAIIFVYIFFFMYYREKFSKFVYRMLPEHEHPKARVIMNQTSNITQQYLSGVLIVILILSVLNSVGLMVVGVENAIFFGCLAAILNIIPYIGVLIGSLFPIIFTLLTKESMMPVLGVIGVLTMNQFIENNFLTPNIVGSKVKINPLAAVVALIIGGFIWGVAGMILFIPFLGVVKIIFDKIDPLKPFGELIGDDEKASEETTVQKIQRRFLKKNAKVKKE